ncbi:NTP pyrophosphatase, house-cleaning of non-canonical NTPs [Olleya namhaensis]|uniref:NTP pyrophosphatase, house-cleaning of non-canonical NTPs n=2 Tax=Olleya namhaensis TaxID=1144750 RepID=A0A1I3QFQ6_9FLAO|nr:NTP pyrophosphatase, house-cleaning of non-canonical NTPs [Olleya namhaensis]
MFFLLRLIVSLYYNTLVVINRFYDYLPISFVKKVLYLTSPFNNLFEYQMSDFKTITNLLINFRDERDWKQFHNSKDLALAISIEAAELNELFLWKSNEDVDKTKVKEELADIFSYALLLAEKHDLDVATIIKDKIKLNGEKYPVEKSKGSAKKYNQL